MALGAALLWGTVARGQDARTGSLRFEVTADGRVLNAPVDGRLIVAVAPLSQGEPRLRIGRVGGSATPIFAVDVDDFRPGVVAVVDDTATAFPVDDLSKLPPGDYRAQAVLDLSRDLRSPNAPRNLYSAPRQISVISTSDAVVPFVLSERVPDEHLPSHTEYVRFISVRSPLLSAFHERPIYLRAGVILPRGFREEPQRRYPVRVTVGGYGSRYTRARRLMQPGSEFRTAWLADDTPRLLVIHLDGAGPYGDPYQVNSANNGPYGDAVTQELIPYIENRFRGIGRADARALDGGSTGGWTALALQIFYPDSFNGVWSSCPDAVDFRQFQLVNIYDDDNAYVNPEGADRPSAREVNGDVQFTMRHEVQMENVLGRGGSWTRSGRQWGAWNAVYSPRGDDGHPVPLWDPETGAIDHEVATRWEQYDLRLVLARNWATLGPRLGGKINIWVGEADTYFLNNAVHLLDDFLQEIDPSFDARIIYGPGEGHCWIDLTEAEIMREMGERIGARP
jgi:S-formylglutathione hydrolase FrmB